jgi:hypothetical protein
MIKVMVKKSVFVTMILSLFLSAAVLLPQSASAEQGSCWNSIYEHQGNVIHWLVGCPTLGLAEEFRSAAISAGWDCWPVMDLGPGLWYVRCEFDVV